MNTGSQLSIGRGSWAATPLASVHNKSNRPLHPSSAALYRTSSTARYPQTVRQSAEGFSLTIAHRAADTSLRISQPLWILAAYAEDALLCQNGVLFHAGVLHSKREYCCQEL